MNMHRIIAICASAACSAGAMGQIFDVAGPSKLTTLTITGGGSSQAPMAAFGQGSVVTALPQGDYRAVACGPEHAIALRTDGSIAGWGRNDVGQLANMPFDLNMQAIAAGSFHNLAIRADGTLVGFGVNSSGETQCPSGTFLAIAAGHQFSLGIRTDGTLAGWGLNSSGQLNVPSGQFVAVAAGFNHGVAIRTDGTLVAWGNNGSGQTNVPSGTFSAVSTQLSHNVAIRSNGTLAAWGQNGFGQANAPGGTYSSVAAGAFHSVAVREDGVVVGWGNCAGTGACDAPAGPFESVWAGTNFTVAMRRPTGGAAALQLTQNAAYKPRSDRWTIHSDRSLKTNIRTITSALDRLLALRGVTFNWKDPASQGNRTATEIGFIADEVARVFPGWVGRDAKGFQTLNVSGFEGLTAEALRELVREQQAELAALDLELAEIEVLLAKLEAGSRSSTAPPATCRE